ncbi:unnamed protein product [Caenorhabditis angaria]|uniref:Uncharacterized protein n=1 Tax=Caenorhabditis angaria TaxID=860376 RepID=A0A9P1MWL0_9PELO|nr:unnamed protein product [Caenorhabditis angaria]
MDIFNDEFFSKIAVPMVRDYSILTMEPEKLAENSENDNYFKENFPRIVLETPKKSQYSEEIDVIKDFDRLALFNPKTPKLRLSQKRRSLQQKIENEQKLAKNAATSSKIPVFHGVLTRSMALEKKKNEEEKEKPKPAQKPRKIGVMRIAQPSPARQSSQNPPRMSRDKIAATPQQPRQSFLNRPTRSSILRESAMKARLSNSNANQPMRLFNANRGLFAPSAATNENVANSQQKSSENPIRRPSVLRESHSNSLFSRLSTPKIRKAEDLRVKELEEENAKNRRSVICRPVPDYVRSTRKDGLPSIGGLVGIRAPSRSRKPSESSQK